MSVTLKKTLTLRSLVIYGLIFMNPIAGMAQYGIMAFRSEGNPILSYIIAFTAILFTALSYGKMVEAFPHSGSSFTYAQKGINQTAGFFAGWTMLLDYVLVPALCTIGAAVYANVLVPAVPTWGWILLFSALTTIVNYFGVEIAAKFNSVLLIYLALAIIVFIVSSIYYIVNHEALVLFDMKSIYNPGTFGATPVIGGAAVAVISFLGFDAITTLTEEANVPPKKIGLAIIITLVIITLLFLGTTYLAMIIVQDYHSIADYQTVISEILFKVGGPVMQNLIMLGMLIAFVGTSVAGQSAGSRILYTKGRENMLPRRFFGYLNPKTQTPTYSIIFIGSLAIFLSLAFDQLTLSELTAFGGSCGFILVNLAVIIHSRRTKSQSHWTRNYLFPALGLGITLYILFGLSDVAKIVGVSWTVVGAIVLFVTTKAQAVKKESNPAKMGLTLPEMEAAVVD